MKILKLVIFCIVFIQLFSGCKKDSSTDTNKQQIKTITDVLVKNGEISGWSFLGPGETATNISELTILIDGAAPFYGNHGFIEGAKQIYQGSINNLAVKITLVVTNQGTPANALDLYNDSGVKFAGALDWTDPGHAGDLACYVRSGGLSQKMAFYRNGYYVYLDTDVIDTDESLNILKQFALNIDAKLK